MKQLLAVFPLLLTLAVGYILRDPLLALWDGVARRYLACTRPISYRIERFDTAFGISEEAFASALAEAEAVWEAPAGRELLKAAPEGRLAISLVYDERQAATERLAKLGVSIETSRKNYDTLASRYRALKQSYDAKRTAFERAVAAYDTRRRAHEAKVAYWNQRGGAPQREYATLEAERKALAAELARIQGLETELTDMVATLNSAALALNRLARDLNITARTYNRIGEERGEEFEEGVYQNGPEGASITIYEFESHTKLVRVLAHEFGHALGLPHVEDPQAIMYRLNQSSATSTTPADMAVLAAQCDARI